jgi:hypothetical protein
MAHSREGDGDLMFGASDRIELIATIVMALAAIATAWCAFQATKWSGIMTIEFSSANAARVESTRADSLANSQRAVDVDVFTSWLDAVATEIRDGTNPPERENGYTPHEGTLSAVYFDRMRAEIKPALDAWLGSDPLNEDEAPPTPFAMEEYRLEAAELADDLIVESEEHRESALESNQNGDNYVLTTVGFALVIFFAGVSSKLKEQKNRWIAIGTALFLFTGALTVAFILPIIPPF